MPSLYLDFEFNRVTEENVNLVSCHTLDPKTAESKRWWLHNNKNTQLKLVKYLKKFTTLIGYSFVAEARSLLALGLNPLDFEIIDLFIEYRCITNHNDRMLWGKQLSDGKVKTVKKPKPKWERFAGEEVGGFAHTHSLAEATYKLTGQIRDTKEKDEVRELIISDPKKFTRQERERILTYGEDDVEFLPNIFTKILQEFERLIKLNGRTKFSLRQLLEEMKVRGRFSAHTAIMENRGYPIDLEKTKNFSKQVPNILFEMQREINTLFPDVKPFRWNKKDKRFSENQKNISEWINTKSGYVDRWPKTPTKKLSLSLDAFTKFYNFSHDYPDDNFGAQMVRYLKLKQSLYGFSATGNSTRKSFWDSVGTDGRVRPYLNPFKAQSSRSQPAATGFMYLKPAWMRALVQPKEKMFMAAIDYSSQEYFLSALKSRDKRMIESYLSGDPYFAFAKLSGQVPKDAVRENYEDIRNACKSTVLGISYMMTKVGLANKLTEDTGRKWTEEEAQEQIDLFYQTYYKLEEFQKESIERYERDRFVRLECGWMMFGDNPNFRSSANCRIQGLGASILRKAIDLAVAKGIYIPFPLHDALYMEDHCGKEDKIAVLADCMREAFIYYLPDDLKETGKLIRLDPKAWSPDYPEKGEILVGPNKMKVPISNLHIDRRALSDYRKFSKYFNSSDADFL